MRCEMVLVSGRISQDILSWGGSRRIQCDRLCRAALLFQA